MPTVYRKCDYCPVLSSWPSCEAGSMCPTSEMRKCGCREVDQLAWTTRQIWSPVWNWFYDTKVQALSVTPGSPPLQNKRWSFPVILWNTSYPKEDFSRHTFSISTILWDLLTLTEEQTESIFISVDVVSSDRLCVTTLETSIKEKTSSASLPTSKCSFLNLQ